MTLGTFSIKRDPQFPLLLRGEMGGFPCTGMGSKTENYVKILKILHVVGRFRQILNDGSHLDLFSAPDGRSGIELAQSCHPDLILLDMHLPDMNGLMVFEKLKGIESLRHIPIIALTADAMNQDIRKAIAMGFHSYVTKPIKITEFLKVISDVIEGVRFDSHFPNANS